jgi:hypothetical protein
MEVRFTPEQEAKLSRVAAHAGIDTENLVRDAALHLVAEEEKFRARYRRASGRPTEESLSTMRR